MRLAEIERGDSLRSRLLIGLISTVSGMRLPDAARVAFYHKDFFSGALGSWTQATMRGPSSWSIAERELMAAMVARWNSCPFCVGAHGAIAAKQLPRGLERVAEIGGADVQHIDAVFCRDCVDVPQAGRGLYHRHGQRGVVHLCI
jgi:AhpD family alkylhydroperoxidase